MVARATEKHAARRRILTHATRLFAEDGFDGTSLQDVADAVGVSKPAVLHHFGTKEDLRRATLDAIFAHWSLELPKVLLSASASGDRVDGVLAEVMRFFREDPNRARMLLREALDRPKELASLLRGPSRQWLRAVSGYVAAENRAARQYGNVDAEAYVVTIIQMIIVAAALADLAPAVLPAANASARCEKELHRIAKVALFSVPAPVGKKYPIRGD
jgi:AcrR family transcriptional regulator